MRILISGASGLVGTALADALVSRGDTVGRFVRPGGAKSAGDIPWDPAKGILSDESLSVLEGADAIVHLSGASIAAGRWTPVRKELLRSSRVDSTRLLVDAMMQLKRRPRAFLAASAVGYYGNRGDEVLTESSGPGVDFLASIAREWEEESARAEAAGIRTVILRFGVILAASEGALPQMLRPFRFGMGGSLGNGRQWISWIALDDVVNVIAAALADERYSEPLNVVTPNPVRNADFARIVGHVLHRPAILPAPAFALRLMLGEMADALLLTSQRAIPDRLLATGHRFLFPDFEAALISLLDAKHRSAIRAMHV